MMNYLAEKLRKRGHDPKVAPNHFDIGPPVDFTIILGDRSEHLFEAKEAYDADIPIVYLHGGEHTYKHRDEGYRWAISALADIRLTATRQSRGNLIHAELSYAYNVGALGVEIMLNTEEKQFVDIDYINIGIAYNPQEGEDPAEILKACEKIVTKHRNTMFHVTYSEGQEVNKYLFEISPATGYTYDSLGMDYYQLLMQADVMIGNSSSLVIEAPIAGCGIVLVGDRQKGRELAGNIIESSCEANMIVEAVEKALGTDPVEPKDHPYYLDNTSGRIIDILEARWPEQT